MEPGDDLDAVLRRLDDLDERGDDDGVRKTLAAALAAFPGAPALREWEAALAADDERLDDARAILDDVLATDPNRPWARRERAGVLIELGRFDEALSELRRLPRAGDPVGRASVVYEMALCLDRLGDPRAADDAFRRAATLAPHDFPAPLRLDDAAFEALVADALDAVPDEFARLLGQVVVRVRDYPEPGDDPFLMGVYVGVARPDRTPDTADHLDHIVIFKRAHEIDAANASELRDEVRRTVLHEIAHHFGLEHEDMGACR